MTEWNEMQLKAITTKEKNILVSASAGSGKTTVLIARLMDLVLKDRVPIDAILAMTFTEAAANEMKKRLASSLQEAYLKTEDEIEKAYISRQLTGIQNAHISTIHSFCLSIIQDYYYMIGLDPQRIGNIMDNGTMSILQKEALQDAFEIEYQQQDEVFLKLCEMFSTRAENNDALYASIKNLATLASSKPDPQAWLERIPTMYQNKQQLTDLDNEIVFNFFEYFDVETNRYYEILKKLQILYETRYPNDSKKAALVDAKLLAFPTLQEALDKRDYEAIRLQYQAIAHGLVPPCPDKEDKEYTKLRKQSQDLEDRLLGLLFSEHDFLKDLEQLYPYVHKLITICLNYRHAYERMKEEQQVIDFDDMEHFALEILQCKHGQIASLYRNQFIEIMVDEFQDSNDVQNQLVMLISRENNVFRVGDIKQSIYGFRHAKPQLMRGLIEHRNAYDEVIYLSNNYRSKKMIVDFNNDLFKKLMNINGFSCSYAKEDDVETGVSAQNEDNVPICFHAIFHDEIKTENQLILSKNAFKASYIANQIQEIKAKENRKWKDFVVLVRGNARKEDMKSVFDDLHIPYFIDVKTGFYQSSAVQNILSLLRALQQPNDDIAFVAAMTSPFFDVTIQDFAQAKIKKEKSVSYYQYFMEHPFKELEVFESLRKQAYTKELTQLLNDIFNLHDYYDLHTTIQERTNLDLLFDKAVECVTDGLELTGFLRKIEQISDAQTAEAIPIGNEANVVRVMSIHQSKGLQFPVVFLWSTDKMTPIEFKEFCIGDADLGIAMKCMDLPERYVRTTIPRIAMEHKKDKEELEEEMRILYVATTRAQQQMHIVDCILSLDTYRYPLSMSDVYDRGGYTSWILQAFLNDPSPLFTIKEIHNLWTNTPVETMPSIHKSAMRYKKDTQTTTITTATSMKTSLPESFSFKETVGSNYGTMMHKIIEVLGNEEWDEEKIFHTAERLGYSIRSFDIKTLLALQHNDVYKHALLGECHYELPFMSKQKDTILHGFMDFVSIHENEVIIIDFKTDTCKEDIELIERYQEQLHRYRNAMQVLYSNKTILTYIYSLHLQTMIPIKS